MKIILIILINIFALNLYANENHIIKKVEVLEVKDSNISIEEIKGSRDFKKVSLPIIKKNSNDIFVKFTFDKSLMGNYEYIAQSKNRLNFVELDEGLELSKAFLNDVIEFDKQSISKTIYIKVLNKHGMIDLDIEILKRDNYISKQFIITIFIGLSFGIVFCAFLYYLVLYIYNKESSFIYYSLTQLFLLFALISVFISEVIDSLNYPLVHSIFVSIFYIFSVLFTKTFLDTKKNTPKMDRLLDLVLYIFIFLFFSLILEIFMEDNPLFVFLVDNISMPLFFIVYLFSAFLVYKKGYKPALFYLIAWSLVSISFIYIDMTLYYKGYKSFLTPDEILYLVSPLESLILAFALSYKMKIINDEKSEQKELLIHQNRLASMGEMIDNIAHQWKQPLMHLSYIFNNIQAAFDVNRLDKQYIDNKTSEGLDQLSFMSNTINDFQNFFKYDKQKERFSLLESLNESINLSKKSTKDDVEIELRYKENIFLNTFKSEFLQVLFNLINNAKDAFEVNQIEKPKIIISFEKAKNNIIISIRDNALGIDKEIIEKIFDPYFTTKDSGQGIGLYMSKMIIEKNIKGRLEVKSYKNSGSEFIIKIPNF